MKTFIACILFLFPATHAVFSQLSKHAELQQAPCYINDEMEQDNLFSSTNSKMLDTNSIEFKLAKKNVLDYCNKQLSFQMDSVAIYYSCREYTQTNPNTTAEQRKWMKEVNLKHQFFITFKVNSTIDYHVHFYLDSLMQVRDASKQLFSIKQEHIWNILPWRAISAEVLKKQKKFILPIENISLEYDPKHERFVYILIQEKTDKTKIHQTSAYSGNYNLNKLVVDSETGAVLEKTEEHYSYIANPSW